MVQMINYLSTCRFYHFSLDMAGPHMTLAVELLQGNTHYRHLDKGV